MTAPSVLVVEDERIIAKGIEKRLKAMGYAVAGSAANGAEAVRQATDLRPDIVLMDIHLGAGMDGIEAAGVVRARTGIPVVFLTAHSDAATLERAKLTEPHGYVLKPYEDKDLQTAIEMGLYKHRTDSRLRENEQWLAATLGSIGDGVIATDADGRVRFLNALAERLTGWTQSEAFGRDMVQVFRVVEEGTRRPVENPALAALAKGEVVARVENSVLIDRAGTERHIDDSAAPIRDANGRVSGAVLVFRDVTARRRLERQLEEQRRELKEANHRLEALAATDGLTGLNNRRAFQDKLAEEVKRSRRIPLPLSLLLMDVDHFKSFNDTFGHPAGDGVLRGVAGRLQETARNTDFVARYGGEEFAVVLPNTDAGGAMVMAERVRWAVADGVWRERAITVSVGVATLDAVAGDEAALLEAADSALYHSKRSGRNRVSHASELLIVET